MAATFPGGVKVFTTKQAGDQIASAHINDLQDEVVAVETELRKTSGSVVDHGSLAGLTDNDHPQYGRPVFLTTPKTSTSWDGDARSTTAKTKIDLSEEFGVPAGVKAVLVQVTIRDSGSNASELAGTVILSPNSGNYNGQYVSAGGAPADYRRWGTLLVPCNADGDIYYQLMASGTDTLDVWLDIWGYWL